MSLAETFSGPIFQMTGLMGMAWMFYIMSKGTEISFINDSIQYQMPLLLAVSVVKYLIVVANKFKVKKRMFYLNVVAYVIFCVAILLIDYRKDIF